MKHTVTLECSAQKGGALIIALLAVALVTTSAAWLLRSHFLWLGQTATMLNLSQGKQILLAGLDWSMIILAEDGRHTTIDHVGEIWAKPLPASDAEGWEISGAIEDAQSRFNLNNLLRDGKASPDDMQRLSALLRRLDCPPTLAWALLDWLDGDSEPSHPQGAEDAYYLTQKPPYRSANRLLPNIEELSKIRGFEPQFIDKLRPFVTALPRRTPVNLNTASAALIGLLIPGLTASEAQQLTAQRKQLPYLSMIDAQLRLPRRELMLPDGVFSLDSRYFRVVGRATKEQQTIGLEALLSREKAAKPKIIWLRET